MGLTIYSSGLAKIETNKFEIFTRYVKNVFYILTFTRNVDENIYSSELAQKFRYEHRNSGQNSVKMSHILINQLALKSGLKEYPKFWT